MGCDTCVYVGAGLVTYGKFGTNDLFINMDAVKPHIVVSYTYGMRSFRRLQSLFSLID
jgi:hypothetical protein